MRSLADLVNDDVRPRRWERNRYRHGAIFVRDPASISTPLDRNAKARLLYLAERLERNSKLPGRRNGALGYTGILILKTLLLRFANGRTGLCCPSYTALQCATGLCRQAIADALSRLEASGLLKITRRIVRERVTRVSPITGLSEQILTTVQSSNLYSFSEHICDVLDRLPGAIARAFPVSRQRALWSLLFGCETESTEKSGTNPFILSKGNNL